MGVPGKCVCTKAPFFGELLLVCGCLRDTYLGEKKRQGKEKQVEIEFAKNKVVVSVFPSIWEESGNKLK